MKLDYDERADAAFVCLDDAGMPPGSGGPSRQLDQDRILRLGRDGHLLAYEFLGVRRYGVRLDDLEDRDELRSIFREAGIPERTWSAPLSAGRRRVVKKAATSTGVSTA